MNLSRSHGNIRNIIVIVTIEKKHVSVNRGFLIWFSLILHSIITVFSKKGDMLCGMSLKNLP